MKNENRYLTKDYIEKNHSYHVEDACFKWKNFFNILKKSSFNFDTVNSITEIGCGSGEILREAKKSNCFKSECIIEGYDINSDAINLAKNNSDLINFYNKDFLNLVTDNRDLIIAADVFEHVQNTYNFLTKLREKGNFFLFNIPIEISLLSMIRKKNIYKHSYKNVGHLHYYNKRTSLLLLENNGFKILSYKLVNNRFEKFKNKKNLVSFFINLPLYLLEMFSKNLACSIFGGYSLIVLAKNR